MTGNPDDVSREELLRELERSRAREHGMERALGELARSSSLIAHELKNATSAAALALRAAADSLGVDGEQALGDLVARLQNVERGVRRALSYAAPLDPRPATCGLAALLARALEARRTACDAAGTAVALDVSDDLRVRADESHVLTMVGELLDNALRDARGGRVRASARRDGRRVVLTVDDDGPGFSEQARAHLFQPFAAASPDGTGTGLATCRRLAEANGGTVEATEGELGGACLRLTLPHA